MFFKKYEQEQYYDFGVSLFFVLILCIPFLCFCHEAIIKVVSMWFIYYGFIEGLIRSLMIIGGPIISLILIKCSLMSIATIEKKDDVSVFVKTHYITIGLITAPFILVFGPIIAIFMELYRKLKQRGNC